MRYVALLFVVACANEPEPPFVLAPPAPTVTVVRSVTLPCAPAPPAATPSAKAAAPAADPEPPAYVAGLGTLRVSVARSKDSAKGQKRTLDKLLEGRGWRFEVWGTRSGKDKKVRARVQARDVDPAAGRALCAWLKDKGWRPGAVPCEMRR